MASRAAEPLTAQPKALDLGRIAQGTTVSAKVLLINSSARTLPIQDITTSCGCTSATPIHEVLGHQAREITVSYDSSHDSGKVEKLVQVTAVGHEERPLMFSIVADVQQQFSATPAQVDLGKVDLNSPRRIVFDLTRVDGKNLLGAKFSLKGVGNWEVHQTSPKTCHVEGTFHPSNLPGQYAQNVTVQSSVKDPEFRIPVVYSVTPAFLVSPEKINCGILSPNTTFETNLLIKGPRGFRIAAVHSDKSVTTSVSSVSKDCVKMHVRYRSGGIERQYITNEVVLETNIPKQPKIVVPLYAAVGAGQRPLKEEK